MGAPLRGGRGELETGPLDLGPIGNVFEDILDAAGDVSEGEVQLLAVIRRRLAILERRRGLKAALEAARQIRQIWFQAIEEADDFSERPKLD